MNEKLAELCGVLNTIGDEVYLKADDDLPAINPKYGTSLPYLGSKELSELPKILASKVKNSSVRELDEDELSLVDSIIDDLNNMKKQLIPNIFRDQSVRQNLTSDLIPHPTYTFIVTLTAIESSLDWLLGWDKLEPDLLPKNIRKRLRSMNAEIDQIFPDLQNLNDQIKIIKEAKSTAIELPLVLQDLEKAKVQSSRSLKSVESAEVVTAEAKEKMLKDGAEISDMKLQAQTLLRLAEDTLASATSVSMAKAFQDKEDVLKKSILLWSCLLSVSLVAMCAIGFFRESSIAPLLSATAGAISWSIIFMQLTLTALLLSAPIWLAWVSTKQINQRFKLQQDYSFKAASANAYEGYRRVADRLDEAAALRLFNAALSRFEESPTDLLDKDNYATPFSEQLSELKKSYFFNSDKPLRNSDSKAVRERRNLLRKKNQRL